MTSHRLLISKETFITVIASIAILAICTATQKKYDAIMHPLAGLEVRVEKHVLPSKILTYSMFGFNNVIADYYWLSIIQDFSGWNRRDSFLLDEYKNLRTADKAFAYPYLFGILTIPVKTDPSSMNLVLPLAEDGMRNLPYNWEIPFYVGTQYQLMKKPSEALAFIERAASLPLVPEIVTNVYNSFKRRGIEGDTATRSFVQAIYETTESKVTKKIIGDTILIQDATYVLNRLTQDYKSRFGKYPTSLNDLIEKNMIRVDDELRNKIIVTINSNNGFVQVELRSE